jgi:hypothetical protein
MKGLERQGKGGKRLILAWRRSEFLPISAQTTGFLGRNYSEIIRRERPRDGPPKALEPREMVEWMY